MSRRMDFTVLVLLCALAACSGTPEAGGYYETGAEDGRGRWQPATASTVDASTSFAHPVHFISSFNSDGSKENARKIREYLSSEETGRSSRYTGRRYPSTKRSDPAMEYYSGLYGKLKDVEMVLPKEKAIILPMVNGRPKPYEGYRAAAEAEEEVEGGYRRNGKDAYRVKRSPAEYRGGIFPHFDYSDPENAARVEKDGKRGKSYPKKHEAREGRKPFDYYKYPKGNRKTSKRSSQDDDEEEKEEDEEVPAYRYEYDGSVVVPELTIKYYPYEKQRDSKEEGSEMDEYTAGYESYKKTLPTDLESYFGKPDFGDFSADATENLDEKKNCEKMTRKNGTAETGEVCYICTDENTGGKYEQCAYRSEPKSEKYFIGGSTSSRTAENPEPVKYRYRRSPFDLERFVFGGDVTRKVRENGELDRGRRKYKKKWTAFGRGADEEEDRDHRGASSGRRNRKSKGGDGPPESYDGPRYTYEGPRKTYEGPIHKDYYIASDDRIEEEEEEGSPTEESKPRREYREHSYRPDRRYGPSARERYEEPRSEAEASEEEERGYSADYRFGPEHFVDDEEERPRQKSESKPKPERRKHGESRQAAPSETEEKESGNVKVFKNGDVCRKKKVDGMICMVCKNEKTAATYEQCQYSSKPKDKYYAFGSQKSYRTSDPSGRPGRAEAGARSDDEEEEEDQRPEKSDVIEKKILITKQSKIFRDDSGPLESLPAIPDLLGAPSDNLETQLYEPRNDTEARVSVMRMEPRDGIEGLEEYLYSDPEDSEKKASDEEYRSYDEYFRDIFPEFAPKKETSQESRESGEADGDDDEEDAEESEESERRVNFDPFSNIRKFRDDSPSFLEDYRSHRGDDEEDEEEEEEEDDGGRSAEASNEEPLRLKDRKSRIPKDFFAEESEDYHKKDIEKALGEFQSRDWSDCKKIVKDKLTCYQCVDKNGVNNEECMYVEASQPMNQQLAYHERKELMPEVSPAATTTTTTTTTTEAPKPGRRMRRPKNARPEEQGSVATEPQTRRRPIGDFGGATAAPEVDVMTPVPSATTASVVEGASARAANRNPKRRKPSEQRVESTTERIRKRKYPIKKFQEAAGGNGTEAKAVEPARPAPPSAAAH